MKIKPSTSTSLTNKKTAPPTVGKISKPKRFKTKPKTFGSKLTSTPTNAQENAKKQLSAHKSSNKKNKNISPELKLGLKIERLLENGGPNVIKLSSESETPKTSSSKKNKKKKKGNKEGSNDAEVSNKNELLTPKKKNTKGGVKKENHEIHNQKKVLKPGTTSKNKVEQRKFKNEIDAGSQSTVETDEHSENKKDDTVYSWSVPCHFNLQPDKVLSAVNALKERTKKKFELQKKVELFESNTEEILLQVVPVKKIKCPKRMLRFRIPHPIVHDLTDVCLIVKNNRGKTKGNEETIEHYKELFAQNNITGIKEIITSKMLTEEYKEFEMKRKLHDRFDIFLADSRISHFLFKELGREFVYTKKHPIPVRLSEGDMKVNLEKALKKTQMKISPDSDIFTAVVGHMGQSSEEIAANVYAVAECLAEQLPGNWPNVRALNLTTTGLTKSFPLPVYISLLSPNSVPDPVMEPPVKKGDIIVEDELSTMLDGRVRVLPDGTIHVLKDKARTSSLSDAEDEEILALAAQHKREARSARVDDGIKANPKPKNKSDKILQSAEEKFVELYKGNLDDIDIDEDDNIANGSGSEDNDNKDNDIVDDGNLSDGDIEDNLDTSHEIDTNKMPKKRKSSTQLVEVKKTKKLKKLPPKGDEDNGDGETERKVKRKKLKSERVARTNWIKSNKKAGSKKLSKSQRKAKIKTKNLKKQ